MNFLIWLAVMPSIIIGLLIYKADKKEKEPTSELIKAALMGVVAIIVTLIISFITGVTKISINNLNSIETILYTFLGIALVEEFSKWLCTYLFVKNNKNFNYLFDGIVYAVFVSLGFATIENVLYTFSGGVLTGIIRAVTTVPSHAFYGIFMGYYLSRAKEAKIKNNNDSIKYYSYSLITPTLLHGIFDSLLLLQNIFLLLIFIIFVIILYIISINKVKKLSLDECLFEEDTTTILLTNEINYCSNCGTKIEGKFCINCGKEVKPNS